MSREIPVPFLTYYQADTHSGSAAAPSHTFVPGKCMLRFAAFHTADCIITVCPTYYHVFVCCQELMKQEHI